MFLLELIPPAYVRELKGPTSEPGPFLKGSDMQLSDGARRLLDLLNWYKRKFPVVRPSLQKLAAHVERCTRTVKRWISELKKAGCLAVTCHGPRGAVYVPDVPDRVPDCVPDSRPLLLKSYSRTVSRGYRPFQNPERKPPATEPNYILPHKLEAYKAAVAALELRRSASA